MVESVGKHSDGFVAAVERIAVGVYVHSVGQTADHEHPWAPLAQVGYELSYNVLPIHGTVARAYDGHNLGLVEVG